MLRTMRGSARGHLLRRRPWPVGPRASHRPLPTIPDSEEFIGHLNRVLRQNCGWRPEQFTILDFGDRVINGKDQWAEEFDNKPEGWDLLPERLTVVQVGLREERAGGLGIDLANSTLRFHRCAEIAARRAHEEESFYLFSLFLIPYGFLDR